MIINVIGFCILAALCLFLGFFIFNNILLFSFLFADYNLRSFYKPEEYPPASTWQYTKNFWRELFYVLGKYYLWPVKWLNLTIKGQENVRTAILLIHGFGRHQGDWLWMRKQFKATSCSIYCVNLEPSFASLQDIAKNSLPEKIKSIKTQTNCNNIILIGHSMGGLVASYYSEFLDSDKMIRAVITIGSPLSGTRVSVFAKGENGRQMCPGSEFLTQLHASIHQAPQKFYQVASKFDNLIYPWQSALLERNHPQQQLVMPFTGHLEMLHSKDVVTQLNTWIKALQ